jgi:hypothetical protein
MDTERGMNGAAAFLSSNTSNAAYAASSNGLTPNTQMTFLMYLEILT